MSLAKNLQYLKLYFKNNGIYLILYISCISTILSVPMSFLFLTAITLVVQTVKNLPAMWETGFDPWIEKIPWKREWLPIPVFLPRKFHGQRLHSPWGHKGSDTTEPLTLSLHSRNRVIYIHIYTYPKTTAGKTKNKLQEISKVSRSNCP